jgi:cytochrome b561
VFASLTERLPHKRTILKALHYSVLPLFIWFTLVQPQDVRAIGAWAFQLHSVFGLIFVSLALFWTGLYLRKGLIGRPGPKLPPWARKVHQGLHKVLIWGIFLVAFTGFLLGLTSSVLLWAGGIVPIAPPLGLPEWNKLVGIVHAIEFYTLGVIVVAHAGFHIWRHVWLRDNALRIMAPKPLHRYL